MNLTIITINRNNASGLEKTLQSVFSQTWKSFEYIVIDGASCDDSVDIIKHYSEKCNFLFRWISEPDTGVYQAMNKGIRRATGNYLLFLNSGDFLLDNNVLERVFLNDCKADILCCRCNVSDKGSVVWTSNPPDKVTFATLFFQGLGHQSTFIKRILFEKIGFYDESFKYNADIEFWYRSIVLNNASTQKIDVIVTDYNLDGISATDSRTDLFIEEHNRIKNMPILRNIFPDYELWKEERKMLYLWQWVESNKFMMRLLQFGYKIHKKIKRLI